MNRKISISFLILICIMLHIQPIAISGVNYWTVQPNWKFFPNNSGPILFNSTAYFDDFYFQGGYAYFNDVYFTGDYLWDNLGFNCSNNSNMTLVKLDRKQIQYIVNAPNANISTTKIKLPLDREPATIIGATNYTYNNKILTVNVTHSSPVTITIEWNTFFQVLVKTLTYKIPVENATVLLSNPSAGTVIYAYYTNSSGYTPQEDLDFGNYSLNVFKEDFQTYSLLFEFTDTTLLEVPLKTIEEGILFNMELLIFTGIAGILLMYAWQRQDENGMIAGAISVITWFASGLWFMWSYVNTERVHFWYLFELFALIALIITIRNVLAMMENIGKKGAWREYD